MPAQGISGLLMASASFSGQSNIVFSVDSRFPQITNFSSLAKFFLSFFILSLHFWSAGALWSIRMSTSSAFTSSSQIARLLEDSTRLKCQKRGAIKWKMKHKNHRFRGRKDSSAIRLQISQLASFRIRKLIIISEGTDNRNKSPTAHRRICRHFPFWIFLRRFPPTTTLNFLFLFYGDGRGGLIFLSCSKIVQHFDSFSHHKVF